MLGKGMEHKFKGIKSQLPMVSSIFLSKDLIKNSFISFSIPISSLLLVRRWERIWQNPSVLLRDELDEDLDKDLKLKSWDIVELLVDIDSSGSRESQRFIFFSVSGNFTGVGAGADVAAADDDDAAVDDDDDDDDEIGGRKVEDEDGINEGNVSLLFELVLISLGRDGMDGIEVLVLFLLLIISSGLNQEVFIRLVLPLSLFNL